MDNTQMPLPQYGGSAPVDGSVQSAGMPNAGMPNMAMPSAMPGVPAAPVAVAPEKKKESLVSIIVTIVAIVLGLVSATFIGLFIWKNSQYIEAQTDVDEKIAVAVADAKDEQAEKDEEEFAEREKNPYRVFAGPADYGQLTFEYPKTWSLYIASNAINGGDYKAFFNPIEVESENRDSIYAIRLEILDKSFDSVVQTYQRSVESGDMSLEVINVATTTANKYSGQIQNTDLTGYIVVFKIRDKTVVLRTDSVLFAEDFNRLLSTITFNA